MGINSYNQHGFVREIKKATNKTTDFSKLNPQEAAYQVLRLLQLLPNEEWESLSEPLRLWHEGNGDLFPCNKVNELPGDVPGYRPPAKKARPKAKPRPVLSPDGDKVKPYKAPPPPPEPPPPPPPNPSPNAPWRKKPGKKGDAKGGTGRVFELYLEYGCDDSRRAEIAKRCGVSKGYCHVAICHAVKWNKLLIEKGILQDIPNRSARVGEKSAEVKEVSK